MISRALSALAGGLILLGNLAAAEPPPEGPPADSFEDEITVSLATVVVRAVDTWGRPILGLQPEDFQVRLGRQEVPVTAVDWIGAEGDPPNPPAMPPLLQEGDAGANMEDIEVPPAPAPTAGRLVVFFVQADLNPTRISGQFRMRPRTRDLLDTLLPDDRVAVVSFDSHLKLWQDFTGDREAAHGALDRAMLFTTEGEVPPSGPPSLAEHFDFAAARRAASPERALELTARAMEPLPGEKTLIFLGWGLGRFGTGGVRTTPAYKPAVRALKKARTSVFVLDVTSADEHSLEIGLQDIAEVTGGMYLSTFRLPNLATEILSKVISGYYVLTLDPSQLAGATGTLQFDLRTRNGTVLARPVTVR